jgi:antirestriction protein ArdC
MRGMTRCADWKGANTMTKQTTKQDPHSRITDRILAELEQGTRPWLKPWSGGDMAATGRARPLRATGQPYRGINVILLWIEAQASGFASPSWMTYRQAQGLGAQVRKGECGANIVYYGDSSKAVRDETSGEDKAQSFRFLKTYTVFNVAQIDGLPERFLALTEPAPEEERIEAAEAFFASIPATVNHGGDKAYYIPSADRIQLPPFAAFHDAHSYYATRGHETLHWTRHKSRLDRSFGREKWGDEGYAREELVAELGAAFLAADLGLAIEPRPDHASYIASWITVLQNDTRAIVQAAAHAECAVAFLHQLANPEKVKAAA